MITTDKLGERTKVNYARIMLLEENILRGQSGENYKRNY